MKRTVAAILVLSALAGACSSQAPPSGKDVSTAVSPDGNFRAVVREVNIDGSVMVSQPYHVVIESLIPEVPGAETVLEAVKTGPPTLYWRNDRVLVVCYAHSQIHSFRNRPTFARERSQLYEVEVELLKTAPGELCADRNQPGA